MGIVRARKLARATLRNNKQNCLLPSPTPRPCIPIAAGWLYRLTGTLLSPMIAATAMSLSSLTRCGSGAWRSNGIPSSGGNPAPQEGTVVFIQLCVAGTLIQMHQWEHAGNFTSFSDSGRVGVHGGFHLAYPGCGTGCRNASDD